MRVLLLGISRLLKKPNPVTVGTTLCGCPPVGGHAGPPLRSKGDQRAFQQPVRGFTLLEIIVALSVLSIGIVTVIELFSGSLRLADRASRRTQAVIYAQEVMDRLFEEETLDDGEESGEVGEGYSWISRVQEVRPEEEGRRFQARENTLSPVRLKELEVRVHWQEGSGSQEFVLRSLRMVRVRP